MVTPETDLNTLASRSSLVSPANCGSSSTRTSYRKLSIVNTAIDSVSVNRRPRHARGPALKGRNASRGQFSRKRSGLNA